MKVRKSQLEGNEVQMSRRTNNGLGGSTPSSPALSVPAETRARPGSQHTPTWLYLPN